MNTQTAKQIPLRLVLDRLGYVPDCERQGELWYRSPFREEGDASFKINQARNIWYDFGAGCGGNVLDFIMRLHQLSDIPSALRALTALVGDRLRDTATLDLFAQPRRRPSSISSPGMTLRKLQPLQNTALIDYLASRHIPAAVAQPYVQEIYYRRGDKSYFALAFANDAGGYELRNPYFKGVYGRKAVSFLRPTGCAEAPVAVFEGFMDFLSALTHRPAQLAGPVLVLNSVAMQAAAIALLQPLSVPIHLYLDLDESGRALTHAFQAKLTDHVVTDCSSLYAGHKDYNDYLMAP